MNNTTTTKFNAAARLGAWWARRREPARREALRRRCRSATLAAMQIPEAVRAAWAHHGGDEFPGLRLDGDTWLRCTLGLAQFFEACRLQPGACALPSKAADSVWHVWLALDPQGLAAWQQRCFGRVVDHREAQGLGVPLDEALARTWVGACRSEGVSPLGPRLPLLFALDGLLGLPTGWAYRHEAGQLVHRQIDGFGRAGGSAVVHAAAGGGSLVALGLLSHAEYQALRARREGDSGSVDGDFSASTGEAGSGDGGCDASSDGGCSGGSSCGSSCGGGGD
ncbi:hypothetical protein [Pelomonas cellulosilytica]|uniref:Uncharacterized protein n=1 Tax=Pelomonas cellulosilytica TaxID=2906762 RepID=A0ABS8XUA6_9BURK|nr:hypothetical protein [Pelomonas sp. P8]MCE4555260.1 hypothetical protein [Pelomonas sp. P8]